MLHNVLVKSPTGTCVKTLYHPGAVQDEVISSICCQAVSKRWQFISIHCVSKIRECAKVKTQFHSSQRWMKFPAPRVNLMCLQLRERYLAFYDRRTLTAPPASWWSNTAFAQSYLLWLFRGLLACFPPALSPIQSLPTQSFWLHFSVSTLCWPSGLSVYLASDKQLTLSDSSLNLA